MQPFPRYNKTPETQNKNEWRFCILGKSLLECPYLTERYLNNNLDTVNKTHSIHKPATAYIYNNQLTEM